MKKATSTRHIAMIYTAKEKPLFINLIAECIKKRNELEPNPRLPHTLKIKTIRHEREFIDLLQLVMQAVKSIPLHSIVGYKGTKWYIQRRKKNASILVSKSGYKEVPNDTEVELICSTEELAKYYLQTKS